MMRPVVRTLRGKGLKSVVYVDDFLLLGVLDEECRKNVHVTLKLLSSLGFLVNYVKSHLEPSPQRKYLGFIFDSTK